MHRLNQAFLATAVVLALLGGVAAADFTRTLDEAEDAGLIKDQVRTELSDADVVDDRFVLTVRIHNPTRFPLQLNGAYTVVSSEDDRISYGSIVNHDTIPSEIPVRGSVEVTYEFALSDEQATELKRALRDGPVTVKGKHAVQFRETNFSVPYSGEVGGS